MAYHVYQTDAFVLKGAPSGDADCFIDIFTRDLGVVRAVAKSARRERSKLRYSLQQFTFGHVALVRGRDVWRVTGAKEQFNMYHELKHDPERLRLFAQITHLLQRLLQGEEKNEQLFDILVHFIEYIIDENIFTTDIQAIECITVMRILYSLGYVEHDDVLCSGTEINEDVLEYVRGKEKKLISVINHSLKESDL